MKQSRFKFRGALSLYIVNTHNENLNLIICLIICSFVYVDLAAFTFI